MPPQPALNSMGGQIRAARLRAGMSQTDLERESGIPKARLSRYENNHVMPSIPSLAVICGAIGVRPGKLVDAVF
jgi:transcriptional regulator with XRE-family HTH domain